MRVRNSATILSAAALAAAASPALGQEAPKSVLTSGEVDALVEARTRTVAAERSALDRFLDRDDVRDIAARGGIDIRNVRSAAATLDDDDVRRLAPRLAEAEAALIGGDTLVISTTTIIIALLILIIILVA
jgi:hypothetical protein